MAAWSRHPSPWAVSSSRAYRLRRQNAGYYKLVDELPGPCAFPRCPRSASVTLQLLVEGDESALVTCDRHADWVRAYTAEDAAVQVKVDVPGVPGERSTTGDMASLA